MKTAEEVAEEVLPDILFENLPKGWWEMKKKSHSWMWCNALRWKDTGKPAKTCIDCGVNNRDAYPKFCEGKDMAYLKRKAAGK